MLTCTDPRGQESPLLHLVATTPEPTPGGQLVTTRCGQTFVAQHLENRELDDETRRHLCLQCKHLAGVTP